MHITLRRLKVWILLIFPMPSNKNRILPDSANLWPGTLLPNYRLNDKYAPKSYQDFFFSDGLVKYVIVVQKVKT